MPAINFVDRVKETSVSTGTGDFTLAGAVTGYQTFDAAFGHAGNYFYYCIEAVDGNGVPTGQWETGEGHLSASTTMVRDTLLASSTGSAVSFSAGTKNVFCTVAARDFERLHSNVPKVYRALVAQTGTGVPSATILENTLGGTPTWGRDDVGSYTITLTGAFTANKTFFGAGGNASILNDNDVLLVSKLSRLSNDTLGLYTNNIGITPYDLEVTNTAGSATYCIEIFVYP